MGECRYDVERRPIDSYIHDLGFMRATHIQGTPDDLITALKGGLIPSALSTEQQVLPSPLNQPGQEEGAFGGPEQSEAAVSAAGAADAAASSSAAAAASPAAPPAPDALSEPPHAPADLDPAA